MSTFNRWTKVWQPYELLSLEQQTSVSRLRILNAVLLTSMLASLANCLRPHIVYGWCKQPVLPSVGVSFVNLSSCSSHLAGPCLTPERPNLKLKGGPTPQSCIQVPKHCRACRATAVISSWKSLALESNHVARLLHQSCLLLDSVNFDVLVYDDLHSLHSASKSFHWRSGT